MDESLGELIVQISADISQLQAGLAQANTSIQNFSNKGNEGLNTFTQGMRQTSRELSQLASAFALIGAAGIAPFVAALASSKDTVLSVNETMTQLGSVGAAFGRTIATDILPGLQQFTNSLNGLLNWFNNLDQPMRAAIENFILMGAQFALITAAILKFSSEAVRVTNDIALLTEKLLANGAAGLVMLGWISLVVVAIGLVIAAMVKWKSVADDVMTGLQVWFQGILVSINIVAMAFTGMGLVIIDTIGVLVEKFLQLIPPLRSWATAIDSARSTLSNLANQELANVIALGQKMGQEVTTGTGTWAQAFQGLSTSIQAAANAYHNGSNSMVTDTSNLNKQLITLANQLKELTLENVNQQFLTLKTNLNDAINMAKFYQSEFTTANQSITNGIIDTAKALQTNLSGAIGNIVSGAESGKQAFADLGQAMIKTIVDYIAQWVISNAILMALGKASQAASTATGIATGAALSAAYAPAALGAMIMSFGAAGDAAAAGFGVATTAEIAAMGAARGAGGGFAEGTDTVPAMLSPGEMIIPTSFAQAIRAGKLSLSGGSNNNSSTTNDNGTNITIQIIGANIGNNQDVTNIARQIAQQTNRELQYPRRRTK